MKPGNTMKHQAAVSRSKGSGAGVETFRSSEEEIVDPDRIRAALSGVIASGGRAALRLRDRSVPISVARAGEDTPDRLVFRAPELGLDWHPLPCEIEAVGHSALYRFRAGGEIDPATGCLTSTLPARIDRVQRRRHRRAPAPPGVRVRLQHPWQRGLEGPPHDLTDISPGGLGVVSRPDLPLSPGLFLPSIELHTGEPGGARIRLRGEVRHVHTDGEGRRICGLRVVPCAGDEAAWMDFASRSLVPTTSTSEGRLDALWELFEVSGFFSLGGRTAESFAGIRETLSSFSARAAAAPELTCQVVWPSPRGVEATCWTLKTHQHTWTSYQLAKRPGSPPGVASGDILRDLYARLYVHQQLDPDFRWALSIIESTTPSVDRSHVQFVRRNDAGGLAVSMPVRLMKASCADRSAAPGEVEIGPATAVERALLAAEIARTRPRCYVEALDLTPERLDLAAISGAWARRGWRREREILMARRLGRPLAAMVIERGEPGVSLFQLLESARIYPLVPLAPAQKSVYPALLDAARAWFARHGFSSFVYLREDDDASYAEAARLSDAPGAEPHLWIISADLVPDLLDHLNELSAIPPTSRRRPLVAGRKE